MNRSGRSPWPQIYSSSQLPDLDGPSTWYQHEISRHHPPQVTIWPLVGVTRSEFRIIQGARPKNHHHLLHTPIFCQTWSDGKQEYILVSNHLHTIRTTALGCWRSVPDQPSIRNSGWQWESYRLTVHAEPSIMDPGRGDLPVIRSIGSSRYLIAPQQQRIYCGQNPEIPH